jgi:hypothetical protein
MSDNLKTPKARLSFPSLFQARGFNGQEAKYSATLIFDAAAQATPEFQRMKAAAGAAVKEKWGDKAPSNLRNPIRKCSEKDSYDAPEFDGCVFINVSTKQKPGVVDEKVQPIVEEGEIYGGCYVRASLSVYAYDQSGNKGVSFGLRNIQKVGDGEAFGGRTRAEDDFTPVDASASADVDDMFNA